MSALAAAKTEPLAAETCSARSLRVVPATTGEDDPRWQRVLAKDASADGEYVYAVRTTRIYCRPSCPSRRPAYKNVRFFETPAAAERAGFRACRRCEPQMFAAMLEKRRMDTELTLARTIHLRLFPSAAPKLDGWEIAGETRPCRQVGGDYYDYFVRESDGALIFALGDVAGKGIGAALLVTSLHAAVRAHAQAAKTPAETLADLNRYLCASTSAEQYATLSYAQLDPRTGRLEYANAGHLPPLLQRNGAIAHVNSAGLPIGLFADAEYGTCTLQLEAGDLLAVASDGITESAGQSDEFFGGANLRACLQRAGHASAGEVLAAVFSACEEFGGDAAQRDDSSLLVLRRQ